MITCLARFRSASRVLWADTNGAILPYVTVMLAVFIGVGALALDGARFMSLQSQLQKAADALALAGAAELDRLPDAIDRATAAINSRIAGGLDENRTLIGTAGGITVTATSIRFLFDIPPSDFTHPIPNTWETTDPVQARFVEVTVTPASYTTILPIRFVVGAGFDTVTAGGTAVAGNDLVSCGVTPMFICNPFEQNGDTYHQATQRLQDANNSPASKRMLIRLGEGSPSGTWGPGDFGYLVPKSGALATDSCFPGGQEIARAIAQERPLICVRQNGVDLLPGNTANARDGLNTRFGRYAGGQLKSDACKATYPPDVNTRTAWLAKPGDWCDGLPDGTDSGVGTDWPPGPNNTGYGVDSCLISNTPTCSPVANLGGTSWNCTAYWDSVYPGITAPGGCTSTATISRYDVYQYEIANNLLAQVSSSGETGTPQCTPTTPRAGRRILFVAVVNCRSSPVTIQSNAQNVPVAAFARFFLTHQVTNQTKPYAEFIGLVERGDGSGVLFDQVQLYR